MAVIGVSTCWLSGSLTDGAAIIDRIAAIGATTVEIDYRVSVETLAAIQTACRKRNVTPVSMHAVCPAPMGKSYHRAAERASLADTDEAVRRQGVADVVETMRRAAGMGIGAVVIHCGGVPMDSGTERLKAAYDDRSVGADAGMELVNALKIERLARRGSGFERLLRSVAELADAAEAIGVDVGVENRYHLREYPNYEELAIILLSFPDSRIGYWHDTGHAQVQDNLFVSPHEPYLTEFSDRIVGVHLHDVAGYTDHLPPPTGAADAVDFSMVARRLPDDALRILELRDGVSDESAAASLRWLADLP
jgi:sugar phosphate isomerase/epimerase